MAKKRTSGKKGEMQTGNRSISSLVIFVFLLAPVFHSCKQRSVYSESQQITHAEWSMYNDLIFSPDITDTISACDILVTLRNNQDYPFRNIFLFITTTSPQGYSIKDTVEYHLANEKGEWVGKGLGDIHDLSVPFKTNVVFPYGGKYQFRIEHGMRTEDLKGIIDVGLRITTI